MKVNSITTVRVYGKGTSKEKAMASALHYVKNAVMKTTPHILLRIELKDIQVVHAYLTISKESFLFFFLTRRRKKFFIELDVTVQCTLINLDKVDFITQ